MVKHKVYQSIINAVERGKLKEPFTSDDFLKACSGFGDGTYNAFLHKHRVGNPGGNSELFKKVAEGKFVLVRPYLYE
jgi:hypothetical protein